MSLLDTSLFSVANTSEPELKRILKEIAETLELENYQAVDQIVGYLLTGEPIYITSKNDARNKIRSLDRSKVLHQLVKAYLE